MHFGFDLEARTVQDRQTDRRTNNICNAIYEDGRIITLCVCVLQTQWATSLFDLT